MKAWLYPTGVERDYLAAIRRVQIKPLEQAIKDNILPILPSVLAAGARQDAPTPSWFDTVRDAFETTLRQANVPEAELRRIVERVSGGVDGFNRKEFNAVLKSVYRVDVITRSPPALQAALGVFEAQNIALIKSIPVQSLTTLQGEIIEAVRTGQTLKDTQALIRNRYGVTDRRAKLIARDQVGKLNSQLTRLRQEEIGVTEYTWRGILDARERPEHVAREGKVFAWDKPPPDGHPGEPIQCFPGSTGVAFADGYDKLWRHEYVGALATIVTSDGVLLESTPNHPILTLRGWVGLGELNQGDSVIQAVSYARGVEEIDIKNRVARFDEVFDLASLTGSSLTAPACGFDFHGEIPQQQVDVVATYRPVPDRESTHGQERVEKFSLTSARVDLAETLLSTHRARSLGFIADAEGVFPECVVSLGRERLALLIGQISHANEVGFGARANRDTGRPNNSRDDLTGNAVLLSQLQNAHAINVLGHDGGFVQVGSAVVCWAGLSRGSVDATQAEMLAESIRIAGEQDAYFFEGSALCYKPLRVVEKGIREYSGPVFNAGTGGGWYMVGHNAIVAHNCRCSAEPKLPTFEELEERLTGQRPPEGTYQPPVPAPAPRPVSAPVPPSPPPLQTPRAPTPARPLEDAVPKRPVEPVTPPVPVPQPVPSPRSPIRTEPAAPLTPTDQEYLDYYKSGGQIAMTQVLRNPGAYTPTQVVAAQTMQAAVNRAARKGRVTKPGVVYRGARDSVLYDLASALVGGIVPVKTAQSASTSKGSALAWLNGFVGGVVLRITIERGSAALGVAGIANAEPGQGELLLPAGGAYRVEAVRNFTDASGVSGRYVDVTLIDDVVAASTVASGGSEGPAPADDPQRQAARVNLNVYEIEDMLRVAREQEEKRAGLR